MSFKNNRGSHLHFGPLNMKKSYCFVKNRKQKVLNKERNKEQIKRAPKRSLNVPFKGKSSLQ